MNHRYLALVFSACSLFLPIDATAADRSLAYASVDQLHMWMEKEDLSAREITEYFLERITLVDDSGPSLNSVIELNPDALEAAEALDAARGPRGVLHGIPVLLKANIDTGDRMTTTAGSLALRGHRASRDAFLVQRLRESGAVILGKTNLSEWANFRSSRSSSGWSSEGRQTKNPYVLDRNPCGSSSGSGVSVAAGLAPLAVGTETDGSVVCPSGINGIVGIKPTLGWVSRDGVIPIAVSQDTAGPMARTVRDAARLLSAMIGRDEQDPATADAPSKTPDLLAAAQVTDISGIKIGVMRDYFGAKSNPEVETLFEDALEAFRGLGVELVDPVDLGEREAMGDAEYEVLLYEFKDGLNRYLEAHGRPNGLATLEQIIAFNNRHQERVMPYFGQEIFLLAQEKGALSEPDYHKALEDSKRSAVLTLRKALDDGDLAAIVAPTNGPAWPIDLVNGDHYSIASSTLAAVSGFPSITVPMGQIRGLPIGISIFGGPFTEPELIRIAAAFEHAAGGFRPPQFKPSLDLP